MSENFQSSREHPKVTTKDRPKVSIEKKRWGGSEHIKEVAINQLQTLDKNVLDQNVVKRF